MRIPIGYFKLYSSDSGDRSAPDAVALVSPVYVGILRAGETHVDDVSEQTLDTPAVRRMVHDYLEAAATRRRPPPPPEAVARLLPGNDAHHLVLARAEFRILSPPTAAVFAGALADWARLERI